MLLFIEFKDIKIDFKNLNLCRPVGLSELIITVPPYSSIPAYKYRVRF